MMCRSLSLNRRAPVAGGKGSRAPRCGNRCMTLVRTLAAIAFATASALSGCGGESGPRKPAPKPPTAVAQGPTYVGGATCAGCHADVAAAWTGSHHDLAMQVADDESMLGDFGDATFTRGGVTTTFFRRDGGWWVNTDGPDGKLVYKTTKFGDRIMDFSHAGYMGGGVALPDVPVKKTIEPSGGEDDTALIQAAIDEVSALPLVDGSRGLVWAHWMAHRPETRRQAAEFAIRATPACIPTSCRRRRSLGLSRERAGHRGAGPRRH